MEPVVSDLKDTPFQASIIRIHPDASCFDSTNRFLTEDPLLFIQALIAKYNTDHPNSYQLIDEIDHWGRSNFQVRVYFAKTFAFSPFTKAIQGLLGTSAQWKEEEGVSFHYLSFLWHKPQSEETLKEKENYELFALTTHHAWQVVTPYADYTFPLSIAKRTIKPELAWLGYQALVGSKLHGKDTYKSEAHYKLADHELDTTWHILREFSSTFKSSSSVIALSPFNTEPAAKRQAIENKEKKPKAAASPTVEIGETRLLIHKSFSMTGYQELIEHFSTIARGKPTFDHKGNEEKDDPFYFGFNNIKTVKAKEEQEKLMKALVDQVFQDFQTESYCWQLSITHHRHRDYHRASFFTLHYSHQKHQFSSPPTYREVLEVIHNFFSPKSVSNKEAFWELFQKIKFEFFKGPKATPLLNYLQGEVSMGDRVCFLVDGKWYEITGQHLTILHRDFYNLLSSSLLHPNDSGFLREPWYRKEEWIEVGCEELVKNIGIKTKKSPEFIAQWIQKNVLEPQCKKNFSFIDSTGTVLSPCINPSLWDEGNGNKSLYMKLIKKNRDALDLLLSGQLGNKLTESNLKSIFLKDEARKAIWDLLQRPRPIAKKREVKGNKQAVIDAQGKVLISDIQNLNWDSQAPTSLISNLKGVEQLLQEKKKSSQPVNIDAILPLLSKNNKAWAQAVLDALKAGATSKKAYYVFPGPPVEVSKDKNIQIFVKKIKDYHALYNKIVDEEGYNRLLLQQNGYLVFDQVYPGNEEKIELFDLLYYGDPNFLYLYAIKENFGAPTGIACCQIRESAQTLASAIRSSNDQTLRRLYQMATGDNNTSPFRKALKKQLENLPGAPSSGEDRFVNLFHRPQVIFVYGLLNAGEERDLEDEQNPSYQFQESDFEKLGTGKQWLVELQTAGYLDHYGRLTQTFLTSHVGDFPKKLKVDISQADAILRILNQKRSQYHSVKAKIELIQLRNELKDIYGFEFRICQIPRRKLPSSSSKPSLSLHPSPLATDKWLNHVLSLEESSPKIESLEKRPYFGIYNPGNGCFLISALQLLFHSPMIDLFLNKNIVEASEREKTGYSTLRELLLKFRVSYLKKDNSSPPSINPLRSHLKFEGTNQEDVADALLRIMQFHDAKQFGSAVQICKDYELKKALPLLENRPDFIRLTSDIWLSPIDYPWLIPFHLPPKQETELSLSEITHHWLQSESHGSVEAVINGVPCSAPMVEKLQVHGLQDTLFIEIKVFKDPNGTRPNLILDSEEVSIWLNRYHLAGFIAHIGTTEYGHYTTYLKKGDSWVYLNDERTGCITSEEAKAGFKNAYILYLERI